MDLSYGGSCYFREAIEPAKALEAFHRCEQRRSPRGRRVRSCYIDINIEHDDRGQPAGLYIESGGQMLLSEFITKYCPSLATLVDDNHRVTALFGCDTADEIDVLISFGADVDHASRYGETRLEELLTSEYVDEQMFDRLLHHGARIDLHNSNLDDLRWRNDWRYDRLVECRSSEQRCRAATKAYIYCLKQSGIFLRDIRMFMVKLLWRTRRWYDWSPDWMERLAKRK